MGLSDYTDRSTGGCALTLVLAAAAVLVPLLAVAGTVR